MTVDVDRPAARAAADAYARLPRPLFTRLPFDYRVVPLPIRTLALGILAKVRHVPPRFPSWPIDSTLDEPASDTRYAGARAGLLLTHDVDSAPELELIEGIRALEREVGVVSSWGFVPKASWPSEKLARDLVAEGCEVYWHDLGHDGRLPYLSREEIGEAFAEVERKTPWASELIHTFRSGQLLMTPELLAAIGDRFAVDLSIPDTERDGPYGGTAGCGTVVPFSLGECLEIPLSLPQDVFLRHVYGYDATGCLELWKRKVDHIVGVGGVAVLNAHPTWVNSARPDMWEAYRGFVEWAVQRGDLLITTSSRVRRALLGDGVH